MKIPVWFCRATFTRSNHPVRRGFGLLELLVSAAVLLLLLGLQLLLIREGSSSWHKADVQSELQCSLQVAMARLAREAEGSTWAGVSLGNQSVSLLSAHLQDEPLALSSNGYVLWKRYSVFYVEDGELLRVEHRWPAPGDVAKPIEEFDFGTGVRPLSSYAQAGQRLASSVTDFQVHRQDGLLVVEVAASRTRYGSSEPERASFRQEIFLRN